jgi:hypothetical protein
MTLEEFERGYAERSKMTVERLHALGLHGVPCDCGEGECEGWQMTHVLSIQCLSQNDFESLRLNERKENMLKPYYLGPPVPTYFRCERCRGHNIESPIEMHILANGIVTHLCDFCATQWWTTWLFAEGKPTDFDYWIKAALEFIGRK